MDWKSVVQKNGQSQEAEQNDCHSMGCQSAATAWPATSKMYDGLPVRRRASFG